jgi:hypothetical protein
MQTRSRPRPAHTETPSDALRKAVYRECDRLAQENRELKRRLERAEQRVEALTPVAEQADDWIRRLQMCVDRLCSDLCQASPNRAREIVPVLKQLSDNTTADRDAALSSSTNAARRPARAARR